jgi:hypothetical protein
MATNSNNGEITGWVGWLGFASFMLLFAGFFNIIEGVADRARQAVFIHSSGDVWVLNYNKWGWINIAVGVLLVIAALSLLKGGVFGRVFGSLVVVLSMLAAATSIPVYPIWSVLILVVDALILYAIVVHGHEVRKA